MVSLFAPKRVDEKPNPNGFDGAINVVKAGQKDFLRSMRLTCEWARESYTPLKNVKPISNFITGVKGSEDFLAFGEFFQSICKVGSSVTNAMKNGVTKTYTNLKTSALEFIWNLFKVMKCLKHYGVYALKASVLTPLMAVGGISFAVNSFDKAKQEIIAGRKIYKKPIVQEKNTNVIKNLFDRLFSRPNADERYKKELTLKNATLAYHANKTAKNVGTLAVGIIVTLKALFAFVAPGIVMLTLGTAILISNTTANIIKESYHLKL